MRRIHDLVQAHDLEKYYANNALVNKMLPQVKRQEKKRKVCKVLVITGIFAAITGLVVYLLKNKEDYYDDDFFFDDDDYDFDYDDFDDFEDELEDDDFEDELA